MFEEKVGGMLFFDSTRIKLVIGGVRYTVSEDEFILAKRMFPAGTFVVLCLCDGVVNSVEADTDIESASCSCVKENECV